MIYYADCGDKEKISVISALCSECADICSCRILFLINGYGNYSGLISLWVQYDKENVPAAVLVKYGGDMTVWLGENADVDEIAEFVNIVGASSVLSVGKLFENSECGFVMKLEREKIIDCRIGNCTADFSPDLSSVHKLLEMCGGKGFESPSYEDFILDTSHNLRHSCADCCAVMSGDTLVSYAMTTAMTDNSAIIGAVCTHPEYRKLGYGSLSISLLINRLGKRNIFIMTAGKENEFFYKRLGFCNYGEFYIYRPQIV